MGLALVVIEEHARRAVHLGNDDALGAVDDKGAVLGHEGDVAHIDVLFLDVLHRLGAGFLVHIEHDQAQRHLQRRGISHGALLALLDIIFGIFKMIVHIFQQRGLREVLDREHLAEYRFQALVLAAVALYQLQELVIGGALNLDQVRHLRDLLDLAEILAKAFASGEGKGHSIKSFTAARPCLPGVGTSSFKPMAKATAPIGFAIADGGWVNEICTTARLFNPRWLLVTSTRLWRQHLRAAS